MISLESSDSRWSPFKALAEADSFVKELNIPPLSKDVTKEYNLNFTDLMNSDNKQLEEFLTMFGGYRAYLEYNLSDITATKGAIEAAFDEGYATAIYRIANEREIAGKKKLTREEVRGAAMDTYSSLKQLKQELIEQEAIHTKVAGLLNAYKAAYDSVSRIVTLRSLGREAGKSGFNG
jgi:hypothetical protein